MIKSNLTPEEKIRRIYENPDWKSHVNERLRYREYQLPEDSEESLEQLVEWYTNKRSKRVAYAGKKLKKLFLDLPKKEQRKVGIALLGGSKVDCEWVCKRLHDYKELYKDEWDIRWYPCYSEAVEAYWNKWHSKSCGKLVAKFLDEETVLKHLDELQDDCYYFELCRRFIGRPWFQLDVEKLKRCTYINAYLSVMAKTASGISKEEARRLLYQWIAIILVSLYDEEMQCKMIKEEIFFKHSTGKRRIVNIWGFDTALYYLLSMNLNEVVDEILQWEKMVYHNYFVKCSEFNNYKDIDYEWLFREAAVESFPDDMRCLLRINEKHFVYLENISRPFTIPRLRVYHEIYEQEDYEMFLKPSDRGTNENKKQKISTEELIRRNPALGKLIGILELKNPEPTELVPF